MSRNIDLSRPLLEEEKEYLRERAREGEVTVNERQFAGVTEAQARALREDAASDEKDEAQRRVEFAKEQEEIEEDSFDPEDEAKVAPLTVKQLRAALTKQGLETGGDKEELQLRLLEHYEAVRLGTAVDAEAAEAAASV